MVPVGAQFHGILNSHFAFDIDKVVKMSNVEEDFQRNFNEIYYDDKVLSQVEVNQSFWVTNAERNTKLYLVSMVNSPNQSLYHDTRIKIQPVSVTVLPCGDEITSIITDPNVKILLPPWPYSTMNAALHCKVQWANNEEEKNMIEKVHRMHHLESGKNIYFQYKCKKLKICIL